MSHTEGKISNKMDFRNSKLEMFLLDSGAGVNIIGEDIANDLKVKIYKLKQERFVTEASGNLLNIIGEDIAKAISYLRIFGPPPLFKNVRNYFFLLLHNQARKG